MCLIYIFVINFWKNYSYIWLPDDDLQACVEDVEKLFELMRDKTFAVNWYFILLIEKQVESKCIFCFEASYIFLWETYRMLAKIKIIPKQIKNLQRMYWSNKNWANTSGRILQYFYYCIMPPKEDSKKAKPKTQQSDDFFRFFGTPDKKEEEHHKSATKGPFKRA